MQLKNFHRRKNLVFNIGVTKYIYFLVKHGMTFFKPKKNYRTILFNIFLVVTYNSAFRNTLCVIISKKKLILHERIILTYYAIYWYDDFVLFRIKCIVKILNFSKMLFHRYKD